MCRLFADYLLAESYLGTRFEKDRRLLLETLYFGASLANGGASIFAVEATRERDAWALKRTDLSPEAWAGLDRLALCDPDTLPGFDPHINQLPEEVAVVSVAPPGEALPQSAPYVAPAEDKARCSAALILLAKALRAERRAHAMAVALRAAARASFISEDYARAWRQYTTALRFCQHDDALYSNRALCSLKLGAFHACVADATLALELCCANSKAAHHLAKAIIALGYTDSAEWTSESVAGAIACSNKSSAAALKKLQPELLLVRQATAADWEAAYQNLRTGLKKQSPHATIVGSDVTRLSSSVASSYDAPHVRSCPSLVSSSCLQDVGASASRYCVLSL